MLLSLASCSIGTPKPTPDPHEGQVYLYDGYDWVWYTPRQGAALNSLKKEDFSYSTYPQYIGSEYTVKRGFDVSEFQFGINWAEVPVQSFDFVYIRIGRRGYTQGGIFEDAYFRQNYTAAKALGLQVGVYFFSQAVNVSEAIEEANWVAENLKSCSVDLPVVFDWEEQKGEDSRTLNLSGTTVTDCAVAFCETIKNAGYTPCVYFNRIPGYYTFDVSRLQNYKIWFALPCTPPDVTFPSFYYHIDMWQYSTTAVIPGISVETDLDYIFIPKTQ